MNIKSLNYTDVSQEIRAGVGQIAELKEEKDFIFYFGLNRKYLVFPLKKRMHKENIIEYILIFS
ncbi:hypothetical protein [Acetivibrio clariflavus]|uniref:Uncharacterized protein n=1 Tax=Acetivibrio clariflavus (strain DSM 19732 / NBRC 101661 / EBR45) TaxID=720554 RepID=G8LVK2_ACECE|nr:hypothetical protein [Acetivibrio clariflavus]AEV68591.1 hypothetical protein Clocl_1992 [Acetivibrio clariflavus DSM 19732]